MVEKYHFVGVNKMLASAPASLHYGVRVPFAAKTYTGNEKGRPTTNAGRPPKNDHSPALDVSFVRAKVGIPLLFGGVRPNGVVPAHGC